MRTVGISVLTLVAVVFGLVAQRSDAQTATSVTLKGQVTCSECWFEADRKTVAYGSAADFKCAVRCAKGGVPGALAVEQGGETTLYILESGKFSFEKDGKNWTEHTAKLVEVTGTVRIDGDKRILKVDSLKTLPAGS